MAAERSVKLVLPSELRLIDLVHDASEKMAELAGFGSEDALNLALAVREAVINAVLHGNRQDPSLTVSVTLTATASGLRATVRDQGNGFRPAEVPDPTEQSNLMGTSGRGLLLMGAFVDQVEFRHPSSGGTEVIMNKNRSEQGADTSA